MTDTLCTSVNSARVGRTPAPKHSERSAAQLREQAAIALQRAAATDLPLVRAAHQRSAEQWLALADLQERVEAPKLASDADGSGPTT